jgi:hypothetical protein
MVTNDDIAVCITERMCSLQLMDLLSAPLQLDNYEYIFTALSTDKITTLFTFSLSVTPHVFQFAGL